MGLTHIAEFGMSVFVVGKSDTRFLDFLISHEMEHTLADDDDAVVHTQKFALHDGADHQVDDGFEGDFCFVEHLRDDHHGAVAS